jgi:hypothetical protein
LLTDKFTTQQNTFRKIEGRNNVIPNIIKIIFEESIKKLTKSHNENNIYKVEQISISMEKYQKENKQISSNLTKKIFES